MFLMPPFLFNRCLGREEEEEGSPEKERKTPNSMLGASGVTCVKRKNVGMSGHWQTAEQCEEASIPCL